MNVSEIKDILTSVTDPEIPVFTIYDLGILRNVEIDESSEKKKLLTY